VGTVGYISPEQLMGDSPDVSWDLWALTVVAYESLTAAHPFPIESREAWRQLVLSGRFRPLSDHFPDPPAAWQAFFDRAFARRPGPPAPAPPPSSSSDSGRRWLNTVPPAGTQSPDGPFRAGSRISD